MKYNVLFIKFYETSCTLSLHLSNYCNLIFSKSFITFNFVHNYELYLYVKEAFLTVYNISLLQTNIKSVYAVQKDTK